jgi:hypothetical protein
MNQITLSENVMVSDPCYSLDTWCQTKLSNVLPGKYNVDIDKTDLGDWGNRISSITAIHENYQDDYGSWIQHSDCGVDSGQCGIFCMTSYRNDQVAESITSPESDFVIPFREDGDNWYIKMCKFTLGKESWGLYDTGAVSSSGIGDGMYPLEVMMDNGKVVGIKVVFLGEDDEDDYEDEGDCCGVCGSELEEDGTCDYCTNEETED